MRRGMADGCRPTIPTPNSYKGMNIYQWMLQYSTDASAGPPASSIVSFARHVRLPLPPECGWPAEHRSIWQWTTSAEKDNRYFVVQRSTDGQVFANIDSVAAATDASTGASYSAVDAQPASGHDFYRLAQVDLDGKIGWPSTGPMKCTILQVNAGVFT